MNSIAFLLSFLSLLFVSTTSSAQVPKEKDEVLATKRFLPQVTGRSPDRGVDWGQLRMNRPVFPSQAATGTSDFPVAGVRPLANAWDVSDSGQVVVGNTAPNNAYSWHTGESTILDSAESWAYSINAAHDIVGTRYNAQGYQRGVVWRQSGAIEIGTLGTGLKSWGEDINDDGVVAGLSHYTSTGFAHAIRWTQGGGLEALLPLSDSTASFPSSAGYGINNSNEVVGVSGGSDVSGQLNYATLWDAAGNPSRIGILGTDRSSFAYQVNDPGQACGYSSPTYPGPPYRGFFWDGSTTVDIGNLGVDYTIPQDINNQGQIVGYSRVDASTDHAFIWENGTMTDLNDFIAPSSGWELVVAYGINERSQIVGWGVKDGEPYYAYFLCLPCCPDSGTTQIFALMDSTDTDDDGLYDLWEECGVDGDNDGNVDIQLLNADVRRRDIYVEVDAMTGMAPPRVVLDSVVLAFENAPVQNPQGSPTGIALHIVGGRGDSLCDPCFDDTMLTVASWPDSGWLTPFHVVKDSMLGTQKERSDTSGISGVRAAKRKTHRYCILAKDFVGSTTSGEAEPLGNDFTVTLDKWPKPLPNDVYMAVFMHELGHTLGLTHGGDQLGPAGDEFTYNYKPNYYSIMNYTWETKLDPQLSPVNPKAIKLWRDSWRLDYSRDEFLDLDETGLLEHQGVGGGDSTVWVPVGGVSSSDFPMLVQMGGPVDFNRDSLKTLNLVAADINHLDPSWPSTSEPVLSGWDDWAHLEYLPKNIPAWTDGVKPPKLGPLSTLTVAACMTYEQYVALNEMRFDCNGNGIFDDLEIAGGQVDDLNDNGIPDGCETFRAVVGVGETPRQTGLALSVHGALASRHKIRFYIPEGGDVTLNVFDVAGRQVDQLVNKSLDAGWYESFWPGRAVGSGVSSGVYFIRLSVHGEHENAKLVHLR
jgi:probable HAF family extracellular repeat protein